MALTDFSPLYEAMKIALVAGIPDIQGVEVYDPITESDREQDSLVQTPAIFIELVVLKPGQSLGDGRQAFICEFIFHCILSTSTPNVQQALRHYAVAVAKVVNRNRWGFYQAVERPSDISACQGEATSRDKRFASWKVSFCQHVYLGDEQVDDASIPAEVFYGLFPYVGRAYKNAYIKGSI